MVQPFGKWRLRPTACAAVGVLAFLSLAYRGEVLGGVLELGGPVVAFFLVLILGFWLVPNPTAFAVTVYVQEVLAAMPVSV